MNKKVLVFALVLVLAVGSVFAAKADMKVGAQLGYGGRSLIIHTEYEGGGSTILNNGFYGVFTFEYGVTDAISVKAEAGINTMGHTNTKAELGSTWYKASDSTPVNFALFVGAMYNYSINKELTVYGGAGIDMLIGKWREDATGSVIHASTAIGLGLEAGASYKINKQFSVNAGAKFAWQFINACEDFKKHDAKVTSLAYKAYAGVTYSL
jgi:opacity protein-like surface antigen